MPLDRVAAAPIVTTHADPRGNHITMNYYEILGIEPTATEPEIRTAYREWMRLVHPDRNQGNRRAEELAKRINAAYEVLSDPAKRAAYDRGSASESAGFRQPESHCGPLPYYYEILELTRDANRADIEAAHRTLLGIIASYRSANIPRMDEYARHVNAAYQVLSDPVARAEYDRNPDGPKSQAWPGQRSAWREFKDWWDNYDFHEVTVSISLEQVLYGGYTEFKIDGLTDLLDVPKGVEDGERFVARSISGVDTKFVIQVHPHRIFQRYGPDLLMDVTVRESQAASEESVLITTLRGTQVSLRLRANWQSGQQVRLQGQGLPHRNNPAQLGELVVRVNITPSPGGGRRPSSIPRTGATTTTSAASGKQLSHKNAGISFTEFLMPAAIVIAVLLGIAAIIGVMVLIAMYIKEILITIGIAVVIGFLLFRWRWFN